MKLDKYSIDYLALIIIGDSEKDITPNKSGKELTVFFNEFGFRDVYDYGNGGLPQRLSRKNYTIDRLKKINETKKIKEVILKLLKETLYLDTKYKVEEIAEEINRIIKGNGYRLEFVNDSYDISGDDIQEYIEVEIEPKFEDIQNQIISEIKNAKYTIWVAVAWFTDKKIFDELVEKKKRGINVQIIISNDNTNILDYEKYFETYRIDKFGAFGKNIMHNKFCIIDLETVLHGSYNWTNMAQYHKEHIERVKSQSIAKQYADRFLELKLGK